MTSLAIRGARVIFENDVAEADVLVADGVIREIGTVPLADDEIDGRGHFLAPALVDIHGDAFERQMMPRPGVFFPIEAAVLETDRQLAANGIATAYHTPGEPSCKAPRYRSPLPPCRRKKRKVAGFYSARSETIPPLPWPNFATPFPLRQPPCQRQSG
jgi:hypothetical protein